MSSACAEYTEVFRRIWLARRNSWFGTARRPPSGVKKDEYAGKDCFDIWSPNLSPSATLVKEAVAAEYEKSWNALRRKFVAEMKASEASKELDLLAALSHQTDFSIGCYCEDESRCHRSILRELLVERGVDIM